MDLFKKLSPDEWKKVKGDAEAYDKEDAKHVTAQETSLTPEELKSIADARKKDVSPK